MDKEKEVKRFGLVRLGKGDIRDLVIQPEGKYVLHSDWQAERTKREEAEKKLDEAIAVLKLCANRSDKCDYSDLANLTLLSFKELK